MENARDLLAHTLKTLDIREEKSEFFVPDLLIKVLRSAKEMMELFQQGIKHRINGNFIYSLRILNFDLSLV